MQWNCRLSLSDDVDLAVVLDSCPRSWSGADYYALASAAALGAIGRRITCHEVGTSCAFRFRSLEQLCFILIGDSLELNAAVTITQHDLIGAINEISSSVSDAERTRYNQLRDLM